jgi:hypothetical protein
LFIIVPWVVDYGRNITPAMKSCRAFAFDMCQRSFSPRKAFNPLPLLGAGMPNWSGVTISELRYREFPLALRRTLQACGRLVAEAGVFA